MILYPQYLVINLRTLFVKKFIFRFSINYAAFYSLKWFPSFDINASSKQNNFPWQHPNELFSQCELFHDTWCSDRIRLKFSNGNDWNRDYSSSMYPCQEILATSPSHFLMLFACLVSCYGLVEQQTTVMNASAFLQTDERAQHPLTIPSLFCKRFPLLFLFPPS